MTYEERVRQRAEEFAVLTVKDNYNFPDIKSAVQHLNNDRLVSKDEVIEWHMEYGRYAVQWEAEAVEKIWWMVHDTISPGMLIPLKQQLRRHLQSLGLVPPKIDNDGE